MITVRYFASIRERLGLAEESLPAAGLATARDVVTALVREHGSLWQDALQEERVLVAINQSMADMGARVADGDEVAFFPPVTGG